MNPEGTGRRRPLSTVKEGEAVTIRELKGGRTLNRRLRDMGIFTGQRALVVRNIGGPVIVSIGECRMAVGRGMAEKILTD